MTFSFFTFSFFSLSQHAIALFLLGMDTCLNENIYLGILKIRRIHKNKNISICFYFEKNNREIVRK